MHHRDLLARVAGLVLAAVAGILLTACGNSPVPPAPSHPRLTACKSAMVAEYPAAQRTG